ncbi:MAG: hypothetical protein ACJAS9_002485 [Polaribacter sp.]|jgi:hypothetical protein
MKQQLSNQNGATIWGWLSLFIMVGYLVMLAFKVVPIYFDHRIIKSVAQDMVDSREYENMSNRQIMSTLSNRLSINNVRGIDNTAFKPSRDRAGEKFLKIEYSQKVNIMGTLSAVADFDEEIRETR